jgi:REP element-mobilizing transposase RayT
MKQGVKHTIKRNSSCDLTLRVVVWIDVFTRKNHRDIIISALRYCINNKGLNVHAYCLMSNHIHLVAICDEPERLAWIKINYIHDNPVKAGLVRNQEDWVYSSASNYCDEESVLEEVHCIVPMLTRF